MTTITAVQLRKDLDNIFRRAAKGESIRVTYRNNLSITIGPDSTNAKSNSAEIFRKAKAISAKIPQSVKDKYRTDESIRELIGRTRMNKYGR